MMAKLTYALVIRAEIAAEQAEEAETPAHSSSYDEASDQIARIKVEVEDYLLAQSAPWGNMGSSHPLHFGDYDFCSVVLSYIIMRHGPQGSEMLSRLEVARHGLTVLPSSRDLQRLADVTGLLACREVCDHVARNLLPPIRSTMAYTIPMVVVQTVETENHILMINTTHCLRWLYAQCRDPPRALVAGLEHHLIEVRDRGQSSVETSVHAHLIDLITP